MLTVAEAGARVLELRERSRLSLEPRQVQIVGVSYQLDGDRLPRAEIAGAKDVAHATRAKGRNDLVGTNLHPRRKRHRAMIITAALAFSRL